MKLELPTDPVEGYIFDCDGTIADTMPIHFRAWSQAMQDFGGQFPEDLFYQWGGTPTAVIVEQLNAKYGLSLNVEETVHRKESYYLQYLTGVKPIPAVLEIARRMHGIKPLAIASGGHRQLVHATLDALGITGLFDAIICAEDYAHGKPSPDPFLVAAQRIGVAPKDCLVFEDGPLGIVAAEAAGMRYVFVPIPDRTLEAA